LENCSAIKLFSERVVRQVTGRAAGIVAPHVEPSSGKVLGDSLRESLTVSDKHLGGGVAERERDTGGDTRRVSCPVRESSGKPLEEVLPMSNRPSTKHLRPSQVITARERGERSFRGLMLVYAMVTSCCYGICMYL
jgi:hypothetical protein